MRCYYCGCDIPNPLSVCVLPAWFGSIYCCKKCFKEKEATA